MNPQKENGLPRVFRENGDDFEEWKHEMKMHVVKKGRGLWRVLNGETLTGNQIEEKKAEVFSDVVRCLEGEPLSLFRGTRDVVQGWTMLKEVYGKSKEARLLDLEQKMEKLTVTVSVTKMAHQLKIFLSSYRELGGMQNDKTVVERLLNVLPMPEYAEFEVQVKTNPRFRDALEEYNVEEILQDLIIRAQVLDTKLGKHQVRKEEVVLRTGGNDGQQGMFGNLDREGNSGSETRGRNNDTRGNDWSQHWKGRRMTGNRNRRRLNKDIVCWNCCEKGHPASLCSKCKYCKLDGHKQADCPLLKQRQSQMERVSQTEVKEADGVDDFLKLGTVKITEAGCKEMNSCRFLLDSGASRHCTSHKEWLWERQPLLSPTRVDGFKNGVSATAVEVGNIRGVYKGRKFEVSNVLLISDLTDDVLLSVGELMKGKWSFVFEEEAVTMLSLDKETFATMSMDSMSLFWLAVDQVIVPTSVSAKKVSSSIGNRTQTLTLMDLHLRLGHCAFDTVKEMLKRGRLDGKFTVKDLLQEEVPKCFACLKSKLKRSPVPKRTETTHFIAKLPLQKVHMDTAELMSGFGSLKYFVVVVDDVSKYI